MTIVNQTTVLLGCEPQLSVLVSEVSDGTLIIEIQQTDGGDPVDIDGLFFNLVDDSNVSDIYVFPKAGTEPITDFENVADAANSLSNGATLADSYDLKMQFGTVDGSTEGTIENVAFTVWSDTGPLTIADLDLDSFAAAVDTDGGDGQALLVNDGEGEENEPEADPDTCTFLIEGDVNVEVVLSQLENGDMQVDVTVLGDGDVDTTGLIGDIRALYFNTSDPSLLDGITVTGLDVTDADFAEDDVNDLGGGTALGNNVAFDGGVEFGTSGIGKDDIQSTSFVLSHPEGLSLDDFEGETFVVRLTSVGEEGGAREDSLKLFGECVPGEPSDCEDEYAVTYSDVSAADAMALMTVQEEPESEDPEVAELDPYLEMI